MSKQEQIIEYIVKDIVSYIMQDSNLPMLEAMKNLYSSVTFEKLNNLRTGLYLESSPYIYEIYKSEQENGKLIQLEE